MFSSSKYPFEFILEVKNVIIKPQRIRTIMLKYEASNQWVKGWFK